MKDVTKEQFYALMGPLNVHPRIMTSYPYTSEWRLQDMSRKMVGKTIDRRDGGHIVTTYEVEDPMMPKEMP